MTTSTLINLMLEYASKHHTTAEKVLERARACGIEPILWHAIETQQVNPKFFKWAQSDLSTFKFQQTVLLVLWRKSAETALKTLSSPCILLKGEPMGARLMGDSMWRSTQDIDLWLPQDQIATAEKELSEAGWHRVQEPRTWATNQILLKHEILAPIELHWALAPRPWQTPSFESAFQNAVPIRILQTPAYILSDDDQWLHLLVHAHQHYFALKTVFDLLAARPKLDIHPEYLQTYHLGRLHAFVQILMDALSNPEMATSYLQTHSQAAIRMWFQNLLSDSKRGELVFGADHPLIAAAGVLLRAFSMVLLDGYSTPVLAGLDVIFAGPHPIGAKCHGIYDAIVQKLPIQSTIP